MIFLEDKSYTLYRDHEIHEKGTWEIQDGLHTELDSNYELREVKHKEIHATDETGTTSILRINPDGSLNLIEFTMEDGRRIQLPGGLQGKYRRQAGKHDNRKESNKNTQHQATDETKPSAIAALENLSGRISYSRDNHAVGVKFTFTSDITDSALKHLKGLRTLKTVDLSSTLITDAGLIHLKGLSELRDLDLNHTKVTDAGLVHLKGLAKLEILWLVRAQVTDSGLKHLKGLTELKTLYLMGTQVTDVGVKELCELNKLTDIGLYGTKVTDAGIAELQKALPDCKIIK